MVIKAKQKSSKKYKSDEIKGSYKFVYLKFNFSFFTTNNNYNLNSSLFDDKTKADLLDRIIELSNETIISIGALKRNRGFETIEQKLIDIDAKYNKKFDDNEDRVQACNSKYYIFRLYPNNNPRPARIIGKYAKGIFYIFFIDLEHKSI